MSRNSGLLGKTSLWEVNKHAEQRTLVRAGANKAYGKECHPTIDEHRFAGGHGRNGPWAKTLFLGMPLCDVTTSLAACLIGH